MDAETTARMRRAVLLLARGLRATSADEGLTPAQSGMLAVLVRSGPCRPSELAQAEALNPTMTSRVVAHLEGAGLVARGTDPQDGRACRVEATAAGRNLITRLRGRRSALLARHLETLSNEQAAALLAALPALESLAASMSGSGSARPPAMREPAATAGPR